MSVPPEMQCENEEEFPPRFSVFILPLPCRLHFWLPLERSVKENGLDGQAGTECESYARPGGAGPAQLIEVEPVAMIE